MAINGNGDISATRMRSKDEVLGDTVVSWSSDKIPVVPGSAAIGSDSAGAAINQSISAFIT